MNRNTRVLAVQVENELFDEQDKYVGEAGITKQRYISDLIANDLEQKQQQRQEIEVKQTEDASQRGWERDDVMKAIDNFIIQNGRAPSQKEYKNENGLPSYGAAGRCLGASPAQYGQRRLEELFYEGFAELSEEQKPEEPIMSM